MTEPKTKLEIAIAVRNEVLDRYVRNDIDAMLFEESQITIPHGKESVENIKRISAMKEAKKQNDHLLRVIDRKIAEYRGEEEKAVQKNQK